MIRYFTAGINAVTISGVTTNEEMWGVVLDVGGQNTPCLKQLFQNLFLSNDLKNFPSDMLEWR